MTKTAAEIREDLEKRRSRGGGKQSWASIKPGTKVYLRILPPWKKDGEFWKDVLFHGYFKTKVYCRKNDINPKTGKPRKCAICTRLLELKSDRSPFGKKLWSLIKQNTEGLWNVLVVQKFKRLESGKIIVRKYEDNKAKLFRLSPKWQAVMMDIFGDEDYRAKSILGVTHPKFGRLIKASRTGSGRDDTNYTFVPVDFESAIFKDKEKRIKIVKTANDLDAIVHGSSQEELEAFLERMEKKAKRMARLEKEGGDDEDNEDEEENDEEETEDDDSDDEEDSEEDSDSDDEDNEGDSDSGDDLESNYKAMKKKLKKKKRVEEDDDE